MKISKKTILFWIIIIIGIVVRIYDFPTALQEMNSDEIMTVINAKSIADTGEEIGGVHLPVYLHGWGGQSVILLYFMAFCIKLFGYSLFAVRLPMLIISIISLFIFYDLLKKLSKNQTIALIGLALVSICPWHMLQSIWGLDCNMFPHFLLIAIDLFYTGIMNKKKKILYLSMLFFSISLYGYGVAIYFVPFFLLVMAIYLLKIQQVTLKDIIICIVIFLVFSLPLILMFAKNVLHIPGNIELGPITIPYYESLSRTSDMLFFSQNPLQQLGKNISSLLCVLVLQIDGAEWNSSALFGTTYLVTTLFMAVGLIRMVKTIIQDKKDIVSVMLISWFCISLFTGIIINHVNINRLNSIWYVVLFLATFGIYELYTQVKYKKIYTIIIAGIYSTLFIAYLVYFHSYYSTVVDQSGCFSRGFYQALNEVKTSDKSMIWYDNIKNDGCLELYIKFNKDDSKQYAEIKTENELNEKIENIKENEIIIVDIEKKHYDNIRNSYQLGDFLVITY